ncbi:hypothetical protein ESA_02524 [Cronobacter sakazakii ATCC BAA-894]|uniref:Uncharacterized protein n=1 Tax=Cronobacter sakazakii (strain ATCC BAA-894) TaxID=290339 RepID=A7MF01_CROS8|nr:hypothetical protein ESA_02524 [Cronobacter sakazakii ATCC BAA-894]
MGKGSGLLLPVIILPWLGFGIKHIAQHIQQPQPHLKGGVSKHVQTPH